MTTTVQKWGNSLGVRIPKKLADEAGFFPGGAIKITEEVGKIIIEHDKKRAPKINLKTLLKNYDPKTRHKIIDWGPPVGREVW